jgi:hypothetical protein
MIQALREQRAAKAKAMQDMNKPDRPWNAAVDAPIWDALMAEYEEADDRIKRIERANALTARSGCAAATGRCPPRTRSRIFATPCRPPPTARAASPCRPTCDLRSRCAQAVRRHARRRRGDPDRRRQSDATFPTSDGTAEVGEIVAQNAGATAPTSRSASWLSGLQVLVQGCRGPVRAAAGLEGRHRGFVRKRLVTRLGRITNTKFTVGVGDGSSEPNGIITAATTGVTAANGTSQVTAILYDSSDRSRALGRSGLSRRQLPVHDERRERQGDPQDQGRSVAPDLRPGYESRRPGGAPDTLLGYPIQVNQDVAVMAANAKSIAVRRLLVLQDPRRDGRDHVPLHGLRLHQARPGRLPGLDALGRQLIDVGGAVKLFVNAASWRF